MSNATVVVAFHDYSQFICYAIRMPNSYRHENV